MVLLAIVAGCAPDSEPRDVFEQTVVPVLEARCTSRVCHGVLEGAEARGEYIDWSILFFEVDEAEQIIDINAAYLTAKRAINPRENPVFSPLLRKPLAEAYGGDPHYGRSNFQDIEDPGLIAVSSWIAMEQDGGEIAEPLTVREKLFADTIQPALKSLSCLNANCHGSQAGVPYKLSAGIAGDFSIAETRRNYEATRLMLSLEGHPLQSRLLRKALPLHEGGIVHKGGNRGFLKGQDDPRIQPFIDWACAEREAHLGQSCEPAASPIDGIIFIQGGFGARPTFDLDTYAPGTDLYFAPTDTSSLSLSSIVNLTEDIHDAPADIRDPAVHPDGKKVAFAMRTSPSMGHALYEMDLQTRELRRLTSERGAHQGGGIDTDRDPTYGPDGHIWFVSTRAGVLADRGQFLDADLYELYPETGRVERRTWTPHSERKPVFLTIGEENGGEIAFSALRDAIPAQSRAHIFRFPPNLKTEYHQHFGITPPENLFHDMRELADGRYVLMIGDLANVWPLGRLGILDRNFGPEIPLPDMKPSLPFYSAPLTRLDTHTRAQGLTSGAYRDPVGLPDGRILVTHAVGDFDLADPDAVFDLQIELLTLREGSDGSGPGIESRQVLIEGAWDPEPVYIRARAEIGEGSPESDSYTGTLLHQGSPLIDQLLGNLPPSGIREFRDDFEYVRLIEALPTTPAQRTPVAAAETRDGHQGATSTALGVHGPSRILAEFKLAGDYTFQAEIPAGVPFRIQQLDEDRMAVGTMHNRWFYVAAGQILRQGTAASGYATRCAACHGSLLGEPEDAFGPPDVLTTASLTLSRYEKQNPRRPRPPSQCDEDSLVEVDFVRDVQPILQASCAVGQCHSGATPAAGLSLTDAPTARYSDAYESLLVPGVGSVGGKRYVDDGNGSARQSFLVEVLKGVELEAPAQLTQPGQTHPLSSSPYALSSQDLLTITRWIDLGGTFVGHRSVQ